MPKLLSSNEHPSVEQLRLDFGGSLESVELISTHHWIRASGPWLVVMFLAVALGIMLMPWQQTSFGTGTVVPYLPSERLQTLNAPVMGVISKWFVVEGQTVRKGESIAEISDIDPRLIERLAQQLKAAEVGVEAAKLAVSTSRKNLDRQRQLAQSGLKSQRDYELAQLEYQQLLSDLASKQKKFTEFQVKLARQQSQTIIANRDGVIMRVYYPQGKVLVNAGDKLATLAPTTDQRVVELFIPGNDLPLVNLKRKVRLQFEGWPAVQFSGWPSVAVGTFGGRVVNIDPSDAGNGLFRIFVAPDPESGKWPEGHYLRQGVKVKGWVLLDTVSAGFEVWRRFNAFPSEIKKPAKKSTSLANELGKQVGKLAK